MTPKEARKRLQEINNERERLDQLTTEIMASNVTKITTEDQEEPQFHDQEEPQFRVEYPSSEGLQKIEDIHNQVNQLEREEISIQQALEQREQQITKLSTEKSEAEARHKELRKKRVRSSRPERNNLDIRIVSLTDKISQLKRAPLNLSTGIAKPARNSGDMATTAALSDTLNEAAGRGSAREDELKNGTSQGTSILGKTKEQTNGPEL